MNTPHKHAEIIKAWADGARIERQVADPLQQDKLHWIPCPFPRWEEYLVYRVEQPPKKKIILYLWILQHRGQKFYWQTGQYFPDLESVQKEFPNSDVMGLIKSSALEVKIP